MNETYGGILFFTFSGLAFGQSLQELQKLKAEYEKFKENQNQIQNFVNNCKKYENKDGFITKEFFNDINSTKCKFISRQWSRFCGIAPTVGWY